MADKTTTNFPKMGTEAATTWSNVSSRASQGLRTPRQAYSMVNDSLAGSRRNILERLGHKGAVQVRYSYPNSPESAATGRNVYLLPPSTGNRQFWDKRQYGQTAQ
ncbi:MULTISPECIES: hypothetical protein [Streptosporangium]|uniref:Uncharacterized protein n=1 Tax=Streptosporangium brasiliense TaxID=47480 RepID=A0ABT9RMV2_9ACTN|nr:hypothetical protein [Streptosporangium brasiliense]MDP9870413.1 hypothetical protein [Streptosporangium brasiliense]